MAGIECHGRHSMRQTSQADAVIALSPCRKSLRSLAASETHHGLNGSPDRIDT